MSRKPAEKIRIFKESFAKAQRKRSTFESLRVIGAQDYLSDCLKNLDRMSDRVRGIYRELCPQEEELAGEVKKRTEKLKISIRALGETLGKAKSGTKEDLIG